jgi:hypothetical protein
MSASEFLSPTSVIGPLAVWASKPERRPSYVALASSTLGQRARAPDAIPNRHGCRDASIVSLSLFTA